MARQRSREHALDESELIVARDELDRLHDDLYVLECAVHDTDRDLEGDQELDARELRRTLDWLVEACRPLVHRSIRTPS